MAGGSGAELRLTAHREIATLPISQTLRAGMLRLFGEGRGMMNVQPGTKVTIADDILVDNQIAFSKGEEVVVEKTSPNPKQPDYKHVVTSVRLGTKFQLRDTDIILTALPAQPQQQTLPPPRTKPPNHAARQPLRKSSKEKNATALMVAAIIVVLLVVGAIVTIVVTQLDNGGGNGTDVESTTPEEDLGVEQAAPAQPINSPKMSMSEFNQIQNGMSYEQVVQIVGGPGEKISEAGSPGQAYYTVAYMWEGEGSMGANANCMFQGGALATKAQFGLK